MKKSSKTSKSELESMEYTEVKNELERRYDRLEGIQKEL